MKVFSQSQKNRTVDYTECNSESSRSHSIVILTVSQKDRQTEAAKSGKLFLVDLAGSESSAKTLAEGKTLEEAKSINKSLSALSGVIYALSEGKDFVPYHDSKLTRILKSSLGGNSLTTLIIAGSISSYNDRETLSTLRFGNNAKSIKNKPVANTTKSLKQLYKQIEDLEKKLRLYEVLENDQTDERIAYQKGAIFQDTNELLSMIVM